MIVNLIICAIIIAGLIYSFNRYMKVAPEEENESNNTEDEEEITLEFMKKEVAGAFSRTLRQNFNDGNLSRRELEQKQKKKTALSTSINRAAYGDESSKKIIINYIKQLLLDQKYDIEHNMYKIMPLNRPGRLSSTDKTNIILYLYMQKYWLDALEKLFTEFDLANATEERKGMTYNIVTAQRMNEVYDTVMRGESSLGNVEITFEDAINIIAQKLFDRLYGFSAVDLLYELTVDEIDCGVSGIPKNSFTVKTAEHNLPYSYESVWILMHGRNIHMECLAFDSQDDFKRVCNNIYCYDPPYPLTQENGAVIATTSIGARILVFCPPFADSYGFTLRKYDSAPSTLLRYLLTDEMNVIPIVIMKWAMKGLLNTIISGQQATGKTTTLKSLISYLPTNYNLRIQEKQAEMNLRYTLPYSNIVAFQETATVSSQEGINITKKTNGGINIIGEIAEAIQAAFFVQTANVASYMAIGTHHGVDTDAVVDGISNNLVEPSVGLYQNADDAKRALSHILDIDSHMANDKGHRYNAYIAEVCPVGEEEYPSDIIKEDKSDIDKAAMDASAYMKKVTNAKPYKVNRLCEWRPVYDENNVRVGGKYVLLQTFSEEKEKEIKRYLPLDEEKRFDYDMEMLQRVQAGEKTAEVENWIEKSLSSF